jgi:tight adherence protein B
MSQGVLIGQIGPLASAVFAQKGGGAPALVPVVVGVAVIALFALVALALTKTSNAVAEERLDGLSGKARAKKGGDPNAGMLLRPPAIDLNSAAAWAKLLPNVENLNKLYEQADVNLPFNRFMAIAGVLGVVGAALPIAFKLHPVFVPAFAAGMGGLPFLWLLRRKKARVRKFLDAMPEAVELISRALRAGHGLASGMKLVSEEMKGPIADEFGRVFEEQNLGIPIELSLRGMAERVPAMDVRFFVIAVVIQRATGGDLAEVLDKIGKLIRQRFELFGHVKALTAEGRLSGIVLLALPPGLLAFLSMSNYGYISPLFNSPVGNKMLMITAGLQVLGAWMIKKIVSIKV